jgi:rusticyanin
MTRAAPPNEPNEKAKSHRRWSPVTRREKALGAVLAIIVLGGGGYAIGRVTDTTTPATHSAALGLQAPSTTMNMGGGTAPTSPTKIPSTSMPPESATGYTNNQLATSIAQQTGTELSADSPMYVPPSQVQAEGTAAPPAAQVDAEANTITFTSTAVSFTVVAVPPGGPDMTFRIGGLVNPTLIVPADATVQVEFINADTDEAHGWEVTTTGPPFPFHIAKAALPGAFARALGDPTKAGDGGETITFTTGQAAHYQYVCPMPGHAQMGMHGTFTVS